MYNNLVSSGGGIKGLVIIGSLIELEKKFYKFKNFAGSSVGALILSLYALGFTPKELKKITMGEKVNDIELDYNKIVDNKHNYIYDTYNLFNYYGYCPGNYIYEQLGKMIYYKTGDPDYTLEDLYKDKNIKLIITTTNLNTKETIYLYAGNPNPIYSKIPIRTGIRMSLSIPFLLQPFVYHEQYYCDGGLLDDYPIHVFDGEEIGSITSKYDDNTPNPKTLGLKIKQKSNDNNIDHFYNYAYSYIETFLKENDQKYNLKINKDRTITIETPTYSLNNFNLTKEQKKELITLGKINVNNFFK